MDICYTFICLFILAALREGNTADFNVDIGVQTGTEGGTITVGCSFLVPGSRMIFCRNDCADGDVLVETTGVRVQRGRYSIEYKDGPPYILDVSVTNLRKSDSGRYMCEMVRTYFLDSSETFELRVEDAPTEEPQKTPATGVAVYVRLAVVILIIVSSAAGLIICWRRAPKSKDEETNENRQPTPAPNGTCRSAVHVPPLAPRCCPHQIQNPATIAAP